jgi:hypothetical protein
MTGVTIDHLVALTLLLAVLTVSIGAYSQIIGAAIIQQQNHDVTMKASDLANTILLSSGYPLNWGQGNSTPSAFGLQDPNIGGYSLSPFSPQRLLSSQAQVRYNKTGMWYSNSSLGGGGSLLVPVNSCVNYTTAAKLLGVNGTYGFQLTIAPTFGVSISEASLNPLKLNVNVIGPGLALKGATLTGFLYKVQKSGTYPSIKIPSLPSTNQTDSTGSAILSFAENCSQCAYSVIVYASLGGLNGVGYHCRQVITNSYIIPFIQDINAGTVLLAHSYDVQHFPSPVSLYFNATYLLLTQSFGLRQVQLANSTGVVNVGTNAPLQIKASDVGILLVAYLGGNSTGIAMMPWGFSPLGFSVTFGGNPSYADWVATEIRQVTVYGISYQVKLAVWSTKGRQLWGY